MAKIKVKVGDSYYETYLDVEDSAAVLQNLKEWCNAVATLDGNGRRVFDLGQTRKVARSR